MGDKDLSLIGFDLLVNNLRKKKEDNKDIITDEIKWYNEKLDEFKKDMINRIKVYDPYSTKSDPIDYAMYSLWLGYNWGDMTINQLYDKKK
jgi:hypothetical protein